MIAVIGPLNDPSTPFSGITVDIGSEASGERIMQLIADAYGNIGEPLPLRNWAVLAQSQTHASEQEWSHSALTMACVVAP